MQLHHYAGMHAWVGATQFQCSSQMGCQLCKNVAGKADMQGGGCCARRHYDDVVAKLGAGQEAARSMGELLSGVGSQLASQAAIAEVRAPPCLLLCTARPNCVHCTARVSSMAVRPGRPPAPLPAATCHVTDEQGCARLQCPSHSSSCASHYRPPHCFEGRSVHQCRSWS